MAFRFSLETVLRVRRTQEGQERLRLQMLFAQRAALESQVTSLEKMRVELNAQSVPRAVSESLPAAELHFLNVRRNACEIETQRLVCAIAELEQRIIAQTAAFVEKSRACKTIENLREKQLRTYQTDVMRKAQAQLDETALLTRARQAQAGEAEC